MSVVQSEPPQPLQPQGLLNELLGKRRLLFILVVLITELAIFFIATSIPINATTQQSLQNEAKNLSGSTANLGPTALFLFIFTHNTMIALGEMVPIFGGLIWVFSIYSTGQIIASVALSQGFPGLLYGALVLVLPFAIVELSAYAVAVASGTLVLVAWRRHRLRQEMKVLPLEVGLVVAMLLTAAAMETVTIVDATIGLLLWIPTGLLVAALIWAISADTRVKQSRPIPAPVPPASTGDKPSAG